MMKWSMKWSKALILQDHYVQRLNRQNFHYPSCSHCSQTSIKPQAEEDGSNLKARDLVDSHGEEQSDPDILGQLEAATR